MCTVCCCASNRERKHQLRVSKIQSGVACSSGRKQWVWIPLYTKQSDNRCSYKTVSYYPCRHVAHALQLFLNFATKKKKKEWCQRQRGQAINNKQTPQTALCWEFRCLRVSELPERWLLYVRGHLCTFLGLAWGPQKAAQAHISCLCSQFDVLPGYALFKRA